MSIPGAEKAQQQSHSLLESIRREQRIVLTYRSGHRWRTYKGSFESADPGNTRFTVRLIVPPEGTGGLFPQARDMVGITYRSGHKKCMFSVEVISTELRGEQASVVLAWPATMQQLQRRAFERVAPPGQTVIPVRFWCVEGLKDHEDGRENMRHGQLENLSAGGMCIKTADHKDIEVQRVYRCVFSPQAGSSACIVDARLRHHEAVDHGRASLGFQFIGLETTSQGRCTMSRIARIVTQFQRAQRRRSPRRRQYDQDDQDGATQRSESD